MSDPAQDDAGPFVSSVESDTHSGGEPPGSTVAPVTPEPAFECEVKLTGAPDALDAAFGSLDPGKGSAARTLLSIYFDTPGGALWAQGRSLRVRKAQGKYLQTLKWTDASIGLPDTRREFEVRCGSSEPDVSLFGVDMASQLEAISAGAPLVARFSAQFRRRIALVKTGGSEIEAALDAGHIIDGDNQLPVREIELELKQGDPADLYSFAEQLSAAYNLRLGVLTKSQRGFLLAAGELAEIRKAKSPDLPPDTRLDDLIGAALTECLDHFVGNWPVLLQADNPDSIHQMRVAIRRLRSLLAVFHREIPNPDFVVFRMEARDIASALGMARDTDVFLAAVRSGPFAVIEPDASIDAFCAGIDERRDEGYGQAHAMLAAPQTTRFVLEMRGFVARRGWRAGLDADHLIALGEPAAKFAARTLDRLDRKARKLGRAIDDTKAEDVHKLRIVLKNVRYCAEMFGAASGEQHAVRKYLKACAHLQDVLGVHNDMDVSRGIVADIEKRAGAISARAAGIVTGWMARGLKQSGSALKHDLRAFRKADRYWR